MIPGHMPDMAVSPTAYSSTLRSAAPSTPTPTFLGNIKSYLFGFRASAGREFGSFVNSLLGNNEEEANSGEKRRRMSIASTSTLAPVGTNSLSKKRKTNDGSIANDHLYVSSPTRNIATTRNSRPMSITIGGDDDVEDRDAVRMASDAMISELIGGSSATWIPAPSPPAEVTLTDTKRTKNYSRSLKSVDKPPYSIKSFNSSFSSKSPKRRRRSSPSESYLNAKTKTPKNRNKRRKTPTPRSASHRLSEEDAQTWLAFERNEEQRSSQDAEKISALESQVEYLRAELDKARESNRHVHFTPPVPRISVDKNNCNTEPTANKTNTTSKDSLPPSSSPPPAPPFLPSLSKSTSTVKSLSSLPSSTAKIDTTKTKLSQSTSVLASSSSNNGNNKTESAQSRPKMFQPRHMPSMDDIFSEMKHVRLRPVSKLGAKSQPDQKLKDNSNKSSTFEFGRPQSFYGSLKSVGSSISGRRDRKLSPIPSLPSKHADDGDEKYTLPKTHSKALPKSPKTAEKPSFVKTLTSAAVVSPRPRLEDVSYSFIGTPPKSENNDNNGEATETIASPNRGTKRTVDDRSKDGDDAVSTVTSRKSMVSALDNKQHSLYSNTSIRSKISKASKKVFVGWAAAQAYADKHTDGLVSPNHTILVPPQQSPNGTKRIKTEEDDDMSSFTAIDSSSILSDGAFHHARSGQSADEYENTSPNQPPPLSPIKDDVYHVGDNEDILFTQKPHEQRPPPPPPVVAYKQLPPYDNKKSPSKSKLPLRKVSQQNATKIPKLKDDENLTLTKKSSKNLVYDSEDESDDQQDIKPANCDKKEETALGREGNKENSSVGYQHRYHRGSEVETNIRNTPPPLQLHECNDNIPSPYINKKPSSSPRKPRRASPHPKSNNATRKKPAVTRHILQDPKSTDIMIPSSPSSWTLVD